MEQVVEEVASAIRNAAAQREPLCIRGGGTKDFYGGAIRGIPLDMRRYSGIVEYEPTELVLTARAGTLLSDIEAAMREHRQMLAYEPPQFAPGGTLGGSIASGLSGPRRPYAGSARDLVLGVRVLDGRGTDLRFGGQVMKNVAGYDLSRLQVGALGTLGVLLEISVKALPVPPSETTLRLECSAADAIRRMNEWAGKPVPVSATCHQQGQLYVRLSGAEPAVAAARARIGGEPVEDAASFWQQLRDHALPFFSNAATLWRFSIKPTTPPLDLDGSQVIEWNGALRWVASSAAAETMRQTAARAGGHATLFRAPTKPDGVFQPLSTPLASLHRRLKETFDPHGVLNPGRLYPDF